MFKNDSDPYLVPIDDFLTGLNWDFVVESLNRMQSQVCKQLFVVENFVSLAYPEKKSFAMMTVLKSEVAWSMGIL